MVQAAVMCRVIDSVLQRLLKDPRELLTYDERSKVASEEHTAIDACRLFADLIFSCFFTGSGHLIWTYCESSEHRVGASRSLLFWVMESTLLRMTG